MARGRAAIRGSMGGRLGESTSGGATPSAPGVRVVLDVRPLQIRPRPDHGGLPEGLWRPSTRTRSPANRSPSCSRPACRIRPSGSPPRGRPAEASANAAAPVRALTVDPFVLRGASVGRAGGDGGAGAVYHTASGRRPRVGTAARRDAPDPPRGSSRARQRTPAAAFGQRLRGRILRDAAAIIVGSQATRRAARRLLHVKSDRVHVVPLAARAAFRTGPQGPGEPGHGIDSSSTGSGGGRPIGGPDPRSDRERLGLPLRYLVYSGRYDARQDLRSLLGALGRMAAAGRPAGLGPEVAWPPGPARGARTTVPRSPGRPRARGSASSSPMPRDSPRSDWPGSSPGREPCCFRS